MKVQNVSTERTIIVATKGTFEAVFPGETKEFTDIEALSAIEQNPAELVKVEDEKSGRAKTKIEPDVR